MYKYYIYILIFIIIIYIFTCQESSSTLIKSKNIINIPHFIPKQSNNYVDNPHNIPLTIYQSWHSHELPEKMAFNIYKNLSNNPEFDYYLYSDEECRSFIQDNYDSDVVNAFDSLIPGAYKSDLWRYCILYKNGGIYFDLKFYTKAPLVSILKYGSTLLIKDRFMNIYDRKSKYNVYNAFMISTANNIIFKQCIDDIVNSCKFKLYKKNPLDITGPGLLGYIIMQYSSDKYNNYVKLIHTNGGIVKFINNDIAILGEYPEYRDDQQLFQKTKRYHQLWHSRNVYK